LRVKKKADEAYTLDGCQVRVYYAPRVRRALKKARKNQQKEGNYYAQ